MLYNKHRSQCRRDSSRYMAFYIESRGGVWTSVREVLCKVCLELGIIPEKKRSDTAVKVLSKLIENSFEVPDCYAPPWLRRNAVPIFHVKKKQDQRS